MLLSIFFFILAGLAEIGGGYLVWLYMRDDKSPVYLLAGAIILFLYGLSLPSSQKQASAKYTQHTAAYSLPSLFYGAGLWTAYDQICTISSAALYAS